MKKIAIALFLSAFVAGGVYASGLIGNEETAPAKEQVSSDDDDDKKKKKKKKDCKKSCCSKKEGAKTCSKTSKEEK